MFQGKSSLFLDKFITSARAEKASPGHPDRTGSRRKILRFFSSGRHSMLKYYSVLSVNCQTLVLKAK